MQKNKLDEPLSEFHDNTVEYNLYSEVKQEEVIFTKDVFVPPSNMTINWENENETLHHPPQVGPPSKALIFDTKELFPTKAQYDTVEKYIRNAQSSNRSDLVQMWETIKKDRQKHASMLKEALEKQI